LKFLVISDLHYDRAVFSVVLMRVLLGGGFSGLSRFIGLMFCCVVVIGAQGSTRRSSGSY